MVGVFSAMERETIAERTVSSLEHKRDKGERMGNVPYGYMAEKNTRNEAGLTLTSAKLVVNVAEQDVITQIAALRASGLSLVAVANALNEAGITNRRGTDWKFQYVDAILKQKPVTLAA
jgi:DNA invertase Pin-like site-specific DNA recombinase